MVGGEPRRLRGHRRARGGGRRKRRAAPRAGATRLGAGPPLRAVVVSPAGGCAGPLASALVQLGASLWYRGQGIPRELFERAMELERGADESIPAYYLASAGYGALLRAENDLDTARPLLERAVERARRRGEESGDLTPLLVRLAYLELDAGNRAASERWLAEATEAAGQQMNEEMDSWLADLRGHIAANQG